MASPNGPDISEANTSPEFSETTTWAMAEHQHGGDKGMLLAIQ